MQSLLSKAPRRTALERRQFTHNAVSQSQTPKLFTRCYTLTYIVSSQLIASYAVAKSQSEVEVGTKRPIATLTLTICPWFLFFASFSARQMQTLCTEYGWLFLQSAWHFFSLQNHQYVNFSK